MIQVTLKSDFCSAHLYHQPAWDHETNRKVFGRCFTPYGHGHNYVLSVSFVTDTADIASFTDEKQRILDSLTRVLDHEHLNFVVPEFKNKIPTTENIVLYFVEKLSQENIVSVQVQETPEIRSEWKKDSQ